MELRELFGLATAFVVLAGITFSVAHGGQTAQILNAAGDSFSGVIRAATQR